MRRVTGRSFSFHFMQLVEGAEDESKEPVSDDFDIEAACTVVLCAKPEAEWE